MWLVGGTSHLERLPQLERFGIATHTKDVESSNMNGLASVLCHALTNRLMRDEQFHAELMEMVGVESEGKDERTIYLFVL